MLATAAHFLTIPSARIIGRVNVWPPMRKFCFDRCVCAPHKRSLGTWIGPKESDSVRVLGMIVLRALRPREAAENSGAISRFPALQVGSTMGLSRLRRARFRLRDPQTKPTWRRT